MEQKSRLIVHTDMQVMLWHAGFLTELKEGAWAQTAPEDHWEFWHRSVEVEVGYPSGVRFNGHERPKRTRYDAKALPRETTSAMRMKALEFLAAKHTDLVPPTGFMPSAPEHERTCEFARRDSPGHFKARLKRLDAEYHEHDLKWDLGVVLRAMTVTLP